MSADQAPAADPTPGPPRVDVAGLRAAAEEVPEVDRIWAAHNGHGVMVTPGRGYFYALTPHIAEHVAAADPTTVLALLDERDDLAARLATAEAEVRELRAWRRELLDAGFGYDDSEESAAEVLACQPGWRWAGYETERRAEVAERQVQAVREAARDMRERGWRFEADKILAALAPLDPDAPTGHDGQSAPDTHQGDTEACRECKHIHTPTGCIGPPSKSDLWAGVTPATCDCDAEAGDGR